ncbi:MAG TPA: hypothetical protein VHF90_01935 [Thermoleophilaceae bacterium]|nr:hypothetical protein [Thermoleophilaceae bacterium]
MRWLPLAVLLAAVVLLVSSADAGAAPKKVPWATVNICDTDGKRNSVGIRAGMPGNGTRQRMYMRFQLQWYRPRERRYVDTGAPSTWVGAGSARFRAAQRGFTFAGIADPPEGGRFRLRGEVNFEWRELRPVREGSKRTREVVVKRARRFTRGGLEGVRGGRPPGRSDGACVIEADEARED